VASCTRAAVSGPEPPDPSRQLRVGDVGGDEPRNSAGFWDAPERGLASQGKGTEGNRVSSARSGETRPEYRKSCRRTARGFAGGYRGPERARGGGARPRLCRHSSESEGPRPAAVHPTEPRAPLSDHGRFVQTLLHERRFPMYLSHRGPPLARGAWPPRYSPKAPTPCPIPMISLQRPRPRLDKWLLGKAPFFKTAIAGGPKKAVDGGKVDLGGRARQTDHAWLPFGDLLTISPAALFPEPWCLRGVSVTRGSGHCRRPHALGKRPAEKPAKRASCWHSN